MNDSETTRPATTALSILHYDNEQFSFLESAGLEQCSSLKKAPGITWVNVDGVTDRGFLRALGQIYNLHELTLQDVADTSHRVKYEDFDQYLLIILKMIEYNSQQKTIETEQLSIAFGANFVITFQELPGDFFGPLRSELKTPGSLPRKMGADYLVCRIIDVIVDNYFKAIEDFGEEIEDKEDTLVDNPTRKTLVSIQAIKKDMMRLRQHVWPVREMISSLSEKSSHLISDDSVAYFRDVYDRVFETIDLIENTRDMVSGLVDIYLSSMSNRTNEVMKVLTVVATIFIPLTFIVGLYGMNFKNMPELDQPWGYPAVLVLLLAVAGGMLLYFHNKKWI